MPSIQRNAKTWAVYENVKIQDEFGAMVEQWAKVKDIRGSLLTLTSSPRTSSNVRYQDSTHVLITRDSVPDKMNLQFVAENGQTVTPTWIQDGRRTQIFCKEADDAT